jgi:hypothetical protein
VTQAEQQAVIVLSTSIPLDGQPPTTLADELFIEAAPFAAHATPASASVEVRR